MSMIIIDITIINFVKFGQCLQSTLQATAYELQHRLNIFNPWLNYYSYIKPSCYHLIDNILFNFHNSSISYCTVVNL